jgi:GAF domain-containing protein
MDTTLIAVMIVGATLAVGGVGVGMIVGYWRGRKRGISLAANESLSPELDMLAGVGNAILGAPLKVDALCEAIYQQATRIVDTGNFQIGLFEGGDYAIKLWLKEAERLPPRRFERKADEGIVGWVRQTGTGLLVRDFQAEWDTLPARPSACAHKPARSAIFAPLISGGMTLGVIAAQSARPNAFDDEDMRLLTLLANQSSAAIRNAQTLEATQERARQLRLINDVMRQVTAIQPLPGLFRQIVSLVRDAFGYYAVNIFIQDERAETIQCKASSHAQFDATGLTLQLGQGLVGWAAQRRETAVSPRVSEDERYLTALALPDTQSEIAVPLKTQDRVLGVLDAQSNRPHAFDEDDAQMLETLAGQLAIAIHESEIYHAERRQSERIHAMTEVARAVVSNLDMDDMLDEVVDLIADHLGYDRAHLFLRVGERLAFRSGSGAHSERWAIEKLAYGINSDGLIPRVARTGQPEIADDTRQEDWLLTSAGGEDTRSEMAVPIRIGPHILGVLDIQSAEPQVFTDEDVTLMQALADTLAVALRNATLFANESRRRMLAETLRELSTVLASSLDLTSVLDGILTGLERVVPYTCGMILLLDEHEQAFRLNTAHGDMVDAASDVWDVSIPADEITPARLIDLLHRMNAQAGSDDPHDEIIIPLVVAGDQIGYLVLERIGPDRFSPEDNEIINTFANQAAVAIRNAQLYMAQREEAWISNALLRVADATAHATTLDEVLSTVARITPLLVGVEWSAVLLADNADAFRIVEMAGLEPEIAAALTGFTITPRTWPPLADLKTNRQPILLDETTAQPSDMPVEIRVGQGVILPLLAKGEVTGLLLMGQRDDTEPMTARKIELVSGIANQAALAIESAQLFAAQQEEAWVSTALLQVAEAVNTQLDIDQSLETIVRLIPLLVGIERCGIMKWNVDHFVGGPAWGLSPEKRTLFTGLTFAENDGRFLARLAESPDPVACGIGADFPVPPVLDRLFESPTLLGLPLIARGHLVGAMVVDHPALGGQIDPRRQSILSGIAHQTASALENVRLQAEATAAERLERELEVARDIQESFMPDTYPNEPGWDVAASYRAARQVGGDFYDFFPIDDHRWALVVADVADKGVPAALFMALSRTLLRAVGTNRETPAATLNHVNSLLLRDSRSQLFVTVWHGVWDPRAGTIVYSSAGHNPPILIRANGSAEELSARGIALGVVPDIRVEERTVTLHPGDLLVAYTDGVTEALRSDQTEFGVVGLQSRLAQLRKQSAHDIAQGMLRAIDSFVAGEPQFDDITMIVLKRLPDPEGPRVRVEEAPRA